MAPCTVYDWWLSWHRLHSLNDSLQTTLYCHIDTWFVTCSLWICHYELLYIYGINDVCLFFVWWGCVSGLRLALGAFCTSPVSSLYTEANEAPLEEGRLKLSMHYYVKTCACIDNPAHHALHEFDRTTRDLYVPRPNGRGGMTQPPAPPIGLKVEEAMTSAQINAELVCPLRTPNFPPGTHDYDPKRHDLIEGVSKCMISGQEAQAKFNEFREAQGSHDEVYTDGSKMNKRVGAAAVINHHFQNGETTCRQMSKRLPDNSTIFAAEATVISLALNYYQHMGPVHHDVVVYSDSMSCLQAIEGEDTDNPFISISWTYSGHWVTRAHVFVSAGYQATVALTEMKE